MRPTNVENLKVVCTIHFPNRPDNRSAVHEIPAKLPHTATVSKSRHYIVATLHLPIDPNNGPQVLRL